MDIAEIHASILLKIDKVGSYSTANLIEGEIDDFINDAIRTYINQQKRLLREYDSMETGAEAQENLRPLISREDVTAINQTTVIDEDGFKINLDTLPDYEYFISGKAKYNDDGYSILKPVSSGYLTDENKNKYNSPFMKGVPVAIENSKIIGIHPDVDSIPNSAVINYLKSPTDVKLDTNTNTELPDHTHRDIVDIATRKIIQSLSGQQSGSQQE